MLGAAIVVERRTGRSECAGFRATRSRHRVGMTSRARSATPISDVMRHRILLPIIVAFLPAAGRAQDIEDPLARDLANLVRDRLAPIGARVEATNNLAKLGSRAAPAVPELTRQLSILTRPDTAPLQEAIAKALGTIGSAARSAIPTMTRAVGRDLDLDLAIKRSTNAILAAGDDDVATLIQLLRSRDDAQRLRAAKALARLGPPARASVVELGNVLADPDADVRRTALAALRSIQGKVLPADAASVFVLDLQNVDEDVRYQAAKNLGRLGRDAAAALPALQPLLADPSPDVRRAAAEAIARLQ